MSDPGYRTDIDWTIYQVCGYCHVIVAQAHAIQHFLESHGGLDDIRSTHRSLCEQTTPPTCICNLAEYERVAALIGPERSEPQQPQNPEPSAGQYQGDFGEDGPHGDFAADRSD